MKKKVVFQSYFLERKKQNRKEKACFLVFISFLPNWKDLKGKESTDILSYFNYNFTLNPSSYGGIIYHIPPSLQPIFHHLSHHNFSIHSCSFSHNLPEIKHRIIYLKSSSIFVSNQKVVISKQEGIKNAGKKEHFKWTEIMDDAFIQAMITQKDKDDRINGTFTSQAYTNMLEELTTKLQMHFTKNHLMHRLKTLKDHFSQWYDMFQGTPLSGFSWNSETQLIEAEDEVWDKLIDSKPNAVMLKTKKVSNFNEMLELFARDRASGLEPSDIPDALIYLANNQAKARMLFSCPLQMRVGILKGKEFQLLTVNIYVNLDI